MEDFEQLDYYELIGVPRDASVDEIKRAYRRQIGRYHPDRYVNASPTEQSYVRLRTQRINEAYRTLVDSNARMSYNRDHPALTTRRTPSAHKSAPAERARSTTQKVANPRDHQAELYEQARAHLDAGRYVQATATLRELQQINPFYRDSATLLAQAEAARQGETTGTGGSGNRRSSRQPSAGPGGMPKALFIGGGIVAAVVLLLGLFWLNQQSGQSASVAGQAETPPTTAQATQLPPTAAPPGSTPPPPTMPPTVTPRPSLTSTTPPASATPVTPSPTPQPAIEQGSLLSDYSADFVNGPGGFPNTAGPGWSVGYDNGSYIITADAGAGPIWSRSVQPTTLDFTLGVDVRLTGGSGGLLLRFVDNLNYLTFVIDPQQQNYRLQQSRGGTTSNVTEGTSEAINTEPGAANRLVARMEGTSTQLFINDQLVAEGTVLSESLFYGLLVIGESQPVEGAFNHFEARTLTPQLTEVQGEASPDVAPEPETDAATNLPPRPVNVAPQQDPLVSGQQTPGGVPEHVVPQQPATPVPAQPPVQPPAQPPAQPPSPVPSPVPVEEVPATLPPAPVEEAPATPSAVPVEDVPVEPPVSAPTPEGAPQQPPPQQLPPRPVSTPLSLPSSPPDNEPVNQDPEQNPIIDRPTPEGVPPVPPGFPTPEPDPHIVVP